MSQSKLEHGPGNLASGKISALGSKEGSGSCTGIFRGPESWPPQGDPPHLVPT